MSSPVEVTDKASSDSSPGCITIMFDMFALAFSAGCVGYGTGSFFTGFGMWLASITLYFKQGTK